MRCWETYSKSLPVFPDHNKYLIELKQTFPLKTFIDIMKSIR